MAETEMKRKFRKEGDFIPPDGGWGWMIVFAAGFSNLSILPTLQQFGLLFRERFRLLGITSSETTTIINMHVALASCVGLANGPVFRTFTYRQVSLTGTFLVFTSLLCATFSYNFATYLISISIFYGVGCGISSSASALAINTYWKKRRRLATAFSWTATGLGPMLWPQIITIFFEYYGEMGTVLILSGFSLHAIFCALLLHPVEWHSKKLEREEKERRNLIKTRLNKVDLATKNITGSNNLSTKLKNLSAFSSQYLYNEDDSENPGYEITDPGFPMMVRANDGYFSKPKQSRSRISSEVESNLPSMLPSKKSSMTKIKDNYHSKLSSTLYLNESKNNSYVHLGLLIKNNQDKIATKPEFQSKRKKSNTELLIPESEIEDFPSSKAPQDLKADKKESFEIMDSEKAEHIHDKAMQNSVVSRNTKLLKLDSNDGDKYNRNTHSNLSLKNSEDLEDGKYLKDNHSNQSTRAIRQRRKSNNFNYESEILKQASMKLEKYLQENEENDPIFKTPSTYNLQNDVFKELEIHEEKEKDEGEEIAKISFLKKIAIFFDLDLLQDFTFINLMLGVTLAGFNEMNFSILTPFILGDFGMTKQQVAFFMSLLAGVDICIRFCTPFIASKIGWDNSSFFLLGVLSMALGRIVLAYCQTYEIVLLVAIIIGFGKGLRTVFMALVIPTHVPLHKLPGASGIQLLTAGITYLSLGPVVGYIKDNASTAVTLHCLNIFTFLTAISWGLEKYLNRTQQDQSRDEIIKA